MAGKMVEGWEDTQVRQWMMQQIVDDLLLEGEEVTYLQLRYALTGVWGSPCSSQFWQFWHAL